MRSTKLTQATAAAIAALLLLTPTRSRAQSEDGDTGFQLRADPITLMPFWSDVDTRSSKFEEYRDMSSGMTIPELNLFGHSADGNRTFAFFGEKLLRDDARYTMRYGDSGNYGILIDHNVIPHRFGNEATLLWTQTSPGVFEISDSVQKQLQADIAAQFALRPAGVNFAFLDKLLAPHLAAANSVDIGLERRRTHARLDIAKMGEWSSALELKREERDGSRPYGSGFGFSNATELPEPIDYDTTSADLSFSWRGDRAGFQAGYRYSHFENNVPTLVYDNPFRMTDATDASAYSAPGSGSIGGAATAANALAPSNSANTVYANARGKFGDSGFANATLQYTAMKQDEELLPYSTNSAMNPASGAPFDVTDAANLPVASADAKVKTLTLAGSVGVGLGDDGTLVARYRHYGYNNETASIVLPGYARFDAAWEEIGRKTVPYEFSRNVFEGEFGWDLSSETHLGAVYRRDMWDRTYREIEDSHEDSMTLRVNHRGNDWGTVRGNFSFGRRNTGEYLTEAQELSFVHPEGVNNQLGLRKFDEAERKFRAGSASLQLMPGDRFELMLGFSARKEDYDRSELGLLYDKYNQLDAELSYIPNDKVTFFVFASRNDRESFQRARQSGGTLSTREIDNWELTLEEVTSSIGGGLTATLSKRLTAQLRGNWTDAEGDSNFFSPPGGTPDGAASFDEYDDNELWNLSCSFDYSLAESVHLAMGYLREKYIADRFARDGLKPYSPGSLFLVPNDADYAANLFWVGMNFKL